MLRYLNMFIIIGLILIGVSLAGFATQNRFLMEPGQTQTAHLSLIYLGAGILMLINGLVSIRIAPPAHSASKHLPGENDVEDDVAEQDEQDTKTRLNKMRI